MKKKFIYLLIASVIVIILILIGINSTTTTDITFTFPEVNDYSFTQAYEIESGSTQELETILAQNFDDQVTERTLNGNKLFLSFYAPTKQISCEGYEGECEEVSYQNIQPLSNVEIDDADIIMSNDLFLNQHDLSSYFIFDQIIWQNNQYIAKYKYTNNSVYKIVYPEEYYPLILTTWSDGTVVDLTYDNHFPPTRESKKMIELTPLTTVLTQLNRGRLSPRWLIGQPSDEKLNLTAQIESVTMQYVYQNDNSYLPQYVFTGKFLDENNQELNQFTFSLVAN